MKSLTHFIAMHGEHGCLHCSAYRKKKDAVEGLDDIYELSRRQKTSLRQSGSVELRRNQGGAYCEISACDCDSPWEHEEFGDKYDWPEYLPVEPEDGDYFIESDGMRDILTCEGITIHYNWDNERELVHFIRERMEKEQFFPNVWYIDDHGGVAQVKLFKHCYRLVK